jgi:Flp pilus assembly protein CpaB
MRRVLILLLLLVLVGGAAVVLLTSGGDDGGETDETPGPAETGESVNIDNEPTPTPPVIPVVVAVQPIGRGDVITDEVVAIRFWPELEDQDERFLQNIFVNEEDVIGRIARTDIPVFSPLVFSQVVEFSPLEPLDLSPTGSDIALAIDPTRLVMGIPLDPTGVRSASYGAQPGDRVDIIMTFAFVDVDEFFQTRVPNTLSIVATTQDGDLVLTSPQQGNPEPNLFVLDIFSELPEAQGGGIGLVGSQRVPGVIGPSEKIQRPRLVTQRMIEDAEVMSVGWLPEDGRIYGIPSPTPFAVEEEDVGIPTPVGTPPPVQQAPVGTVLPTVTPTPYTPLVMNVAVTPQDAVVLAWAIDSNLQMHIALRSANVQPNTSVGQPTTAVTLGYMLENFAIPNPNTLRSTYALEPRASIRRFDLLTLRRFTELQSEILLEASAAGIAEQTNDALREDLLREDLFLGLGEASQGNAE